MPRPLSETRQIAVGLEAHLDEGRMAGDGLVHGVVDHLGEEVVHRLLVGAADVHAGAAADGLQALQHLDVGGGIVVGSVRRLAGAGSGSLVGHFGFQPCKQVALRGHGATLARVSRFARGGSMNCSMN